MKIVLVNTYEETGGAARAANRLFQGLRALGSDCTLLVDHKQSDDPAVVRLALPDDGERERAALLLAELRQAVAPYPVLRAGTGFVPFHSDRSTAGETLVRQLAGADVVNLHWVRGLIDYPAFFRNRPRSQPVVWTLHDMHPFTGGCHYAGACLQYEDSCGACPVLASDKEDDLSHVILKRKAESLARYPAPVHIVAPSRWMADAARRSAAFRGLPVSVIPYGLDESVFRPHERAAVRNDLGLPPDRPVILFSAHNLNDPRKGLAHLDEALCRCGAAGDAVLLLAGAGEVRLQASVDRVHLGEVTSDDAMARAYSAADVICVPSTEDNLPNAVLEGMACGTAVIGFAVGGIPDMIRPGETGFLAEPGDVPSLTCALSDALADIGRLHVMGRTARRMVEREYTLQRQAQRYLDLYHSLPRHV